MTTHYMKAEGGLHQRIWFAKAGRGTHQDIGISPVAEQHLANGTYSFSLAGFDPFEMDLKEATAAGKENSLYPGMGAQFGAQIWRMAHEAQVGDYIFLESENHNLHAVGVITGPYQLFAEDYNETTLTREGLHAVPVLWYPIKNGHGVIQLGRLDNAVFRDIMGKEKLVNLLFDLTQPYIANGLYKPGQSPAHLHQGQDRQHQQRLVRHHTLPAPRDLQIQQVILFSVGHAPPLPNDKPWATRQTIAGDRSY